MRTEWSSIGDTDIALLPPKENCSGLALSSLRVILLVVVCGTYPNVLENLVCLDVLGNYQLLC